jgi:oxygen-independent coproporphyrinogen-3 oxidase
MSNGRVARIEQELTGSEQVGLAYVNIPFCSYRCRFCCFVPRYGSQLLAGDELKPAYLSALDQEIRGKDVSYMGCQGLRLTAIHLGGGTPSLLTPGEIEGILEALLARSGQQPEDLVDIGIEVTPDSVSLDYLQGLRSLGLNRLSIGVQTFDEQALRSLERRHDVARSIAAFEWARQAGFANVNLDLLLGFAGQSVEGLISDLEMTLVLAPEHVSPSAYSPASGTSLAPAEAEVRLDLAATADCYLEDHGYQCYYHKYYARPGAESVTEIVYALALPYVAFGAGAESFDKPINPVKIDEYMAHPLAANHYPLHSQVRPLSHLVTFLRGALLFRRGVRVEKVNQRCCCDLEEILGSEGDSRQVTDLFDRHDPQTREEVVVAGEAFRFIRKLRHWLAAGYLELADRRLRVSPEARFCRELYELYFSRV